MIKKVLRALAGPADEGTRNQEQSEADGVRELAQQRRFHQRLSQITDQERQRAADVWADYNRLATGRVERRGRGSQSS